MIQGCSAEAGEEGVTAVETGRDRSMNHNGASFGAQLEIPDKLAQSQSLVHGREDLTGNGPITKPWATPQVIHSGLSR